MTNISRTLLIVCLFCGLNFIQRVHAQTVPPVLTVDKLVATLYEYEDEKTTLATAKCEPTKTTIIKLSNPSSNPFFNVYPGVGDFYDLQFLPGYGVLSYTQNRFYTVRLLCVRVGEEDKQDFEDVDIRLTPNYPPYFSPMLPKIISSAETMKAGASIYSTSCIDSESDTLTYTLTTNPASSLFTIGVTDGIIRAAGDLAAECRTQIAFEVTCKDPYHPAVGPVTIQATLNNPNDKPTITGMNFFLDVPEDAVVGSSLAGYSVTDSDTTTCYISTTPLDSLQYFKIDFPTLTEGTIQVRNNLNYEQITTRNTNVTVSCTDNYCTSEKAYIYVRITDVNEPITLAPKNFTLTTYEGSISLNPGWTTTDEDLNDYPTYSIVGGNPKGHFKVDPTSGLITSTAVYDVDGSAMPITDMIVVQVRDIAGHTATSSVSLSILDANDNRPVFSPQTMQITINNCSSSIGVSIGTVSATDADSSFEGNNVITYSGGGGPITIGSTGSIIPNAAIAAGNTYTVTAQAKDSGVHTQPLSAATPATITVIVTECPPTTTPAPTTTTSAAPTTTKLVTATPAPVTVAPNTANSLEENMGWIVIAGLLATVFLAALGLMLWKFCWPAVCAAGKLNMFFERMCGNCQQRPSPRAVQPARAARAARGGQPPKAGNKSFWQERYPDDDYRNQPDRDRTPSPAPIEGGAPLVLEPWRPRAIQYPNY